MSRGRGEVDSGGDSVASDSSVQDIQSGEALIFKLYENKSDSEVGLGSAHDGARLALAWVGKRARPRCARTGLANELLLVPSDSGERALFAQLNADGKGKQDRPDQRTQAIQMTEAPKKTKSKRISADQESVSEDQIALKKMVGKEQYTCMAKSITATAPWQCTCTAKSITAKASAQYTCTAKSNTATAPVQSRCTAKSYTAKAPAQWTCTAKSITAIAPVKCKCTAMSITATAPAKCKCTAKSITATAPAKFTWTAVPQTVSDLAKEEEDLIKRSDANCNCVATTPAQVWWRRNRPGATGHKLQRRPSCCRAGGRNQNDRPDQRTQAIQMTGMPKKRKSMRILADQESVSEDQIALKKMVGCGQRTCTVKSITATAPAQCACPPVAKAQCACTPMPKSQCACTPVPKTQCACTPVPKTQCACTPVPKTQCACTPVPKTQCACTPVPKTQCLCTPVPKTQCLCTPVPKTQCACTPVPKTQCACTPVPNAQCPCSAVPQTTPDLAEVLRTCQKKADEELENVGSLPPRKPCAKGARKRKVQRERGAGGAWAGAGGARTRAAQVGVAQASDSRSRLSTYMKILRPKPARLALAVARLDKTSLQGCAKNNSEPIIVLFKRELPSPTVSKNPADCDHARRGHDTSHGDNEDPHDPEYCKSNSSNHKMETTHAPPSTPVPHVAPRLACPPESRSDKSLKDESHAPPPRNYSNQKNEFTATEDKNLLTKWKKSYCKWWNTKTTIKYKTTKSVACMVPSFESLENEMVNETKYDETSGFRLTVRKKKHEEFSYEEAVVYFDRMPPMQSHEYEADSSGEARRDRRRRGHECQCPPEPLPLEDHAPREGFTLQIERGARRVERDN